MAQNLKNKEQVKLVLYKSQLLGDKNLIIQHNNNDIIYVFDSDEEIGVFITMLEKLKNEE